jgi:branched-chain amino acid transport system permease protein
MFGVVMTTYLSEFTPAWQLYTGLLFMLVVLFAPDGFSGLIVRFFRTAFKAKEEKYLGAFLKRTIALGISLSFVVSGIILGIEMLYKLRFDTQSNISSTNNGNEASAKLLDILGHPIDCHHWSSWFFVAFLIVSGWAFLRLSWISLQIKNDAKKGEAI